MNAQHDREEYLQPQPHHRPCPTTVKHTYKKQGNMQIGFPGDLDDRECTPGFFFSFLHQYQYFHATGKHFMLNWLADVFRTLLSHDYLTSTTLAVIHFIELDYAATEKIQLC
jgi:hypothetical protein